MHLSSVNFHFDISGKDTKDLHLEKIAPIL